MWPFTRNQVNRRVERRSGLQVRVRTQVAQAQTARRVGAVFFSIVGTLLALLVFWRGGEWVLHNFLFDDQSYGLRKVDIATDGLLTADEIQRRAGVRLGQNLVSLDLSRIKRELESVPMIRAVTLERLLPSTLRVRVTERLLVAEAQVARPRPDGLMQFTTYRLDAEGMVMPVVDPRQTSAGQPAAPYPLVVGLDPAELVVGKKVRSTPACAALRLVAAFEESGMVGLDDLQRVELLSPDLLQVTSYLGAQVTFSAQNVERQLARWRSIFDYGQSRQLHLASVDLAVSNNVPVRWFEAGSVPAPPREPRPPRTRTRRHV